MKGRILLLVLIMCSAFSLTRADITRREPFYKEVIDKEIVRCGIKAELRNSRGENLRLYGEQAAGRMAFYHHWQQRLIRDMIEESVGTRPCRINYYLIKAYKSYESLPSLAKR
jgi:hypothetical protein